MLNYIYQFPEISLISINLLFIILSYFFIYPKFVKNNVTKLIIFDIYVSIFSLIIAGVLFWDKQVEFSLILFSVNWFWFSLIVYFVLESYLFFKYSKKQNIDLSLDGGFVKK